MMGTIKPSKDQALVARDSKVDSKSKEQSKNPHEQKRDTQEDSSCSKKKPQKKKNKGEMSKCAYCSKGYHPKSSCMKMKIDMLTQLLEKNNISLPNCSKKREGGLIFVARPYIFLIFTHKVRIKGVC